MASEPNSAQGFDHRRFLRHATTLPGVYRMLDAAGQTLYVGKARNLKARLASYFGRRPGSPKTAALVEQVADVELTVTETESEALLLENHLIKALRPRYNVLLRDDKSYPYIHLSAGEFPRLSFHRGARREAGEYFGPYPSAGAVRQTLQLLQKLFRVRQCEDSFFSNRSRPCLQYQIKRCTAPCVDLVAAADYARDLRYTRMFLQGRDEQVLAELIRRMEQAAAALEYETAAQVRDQIANLRKVRERQFVQTRARDLDIVACRTRSGVACVQIFMIRDGRNLGNRALYPRVPAAASENEVLGEVLAQFYATHLVPREILLSHPIEDQAWLQEILEERSGHRVSLSHRLRGERAQWVRNALQNAELALATRLAQKAGAGERVQALRALLGLEETPGRLECFDVSHTRGEAAVASCVVFSAEGPLKQEYRRFNLRDITPGDDYAAMEQVLSRRYTRVLREAGDLPDVIFVDGGKGQLQRAKAVLEELQLSGPLLVAVAKGADRRAGLETLWRADAARPLVVAADSPGLHLVQHIRDEAHRFAIMGHRGRRSRSRRVSELEHIPGLGPKRRQQLLKHFGGLQGVRKAGIEELARVPGISRRLATSIYEDLHGQDGTV